jgi:hypothetical protein
MGDVEQLPNMKADFITMSSRMTLYGVQQRRPIRLKGRGMKEITKVYVDKSKFRAISFDPFKIIH